MNFGLIIVGVAIALMIANRPENVPRLYAADLAGASAACMASDARLGGWP